MGLPKVVVFDLGKVLLDFDFRIFAHNLSAQSKLSADEVMEKVVGSDVLVDYEYGRTGSQEFYHQVKDLSGYSGGYPAFENLFGEIFTEIDEMVSLQRELKTLGVPRFIFSNTNEIAIRIIRQQYEFFSEFDGYIYSYEHRAMKPEGPLYEVVEKIIGCSGQDLVFIDDKEENIHAAIDRGWHGVVHKEPSSTRSQIKNLGFDLS